MKPEVGAMYEVTLSDGRVIRLHFEGFGDYMTQRWRNIDTDEVLSSIPPYRSIERCS